MSSTFRIEQNDVELTINAWMPGHADESAYATVEVYRFSSDVWPAERARIYLDLAEATALRDELQRFIDEVGPGEH